MDRRLVLVGVALLAIAGLGASIAELQLSNVQRSHDALCATPSSGLPSSICTSIETQIHLWQSVLYIELLLAGASGFVLVAAIATAPRKRAPLPVRGYALHR